MGERCVYLRRSLIGLTRRSAGLGWPLLVQESPFLLKMALHWGEKALCCPERALCHIGRAVYERERTLGERMGESR